MTVSDPQFGQLSRINPQTSRTHPQVVQQHFVVHGDNSVEPSRAPVADADEAVVREPLPAAPEPEHLGPSSSPVAVADPPSPSDSESPPPESAINIGDHAAAQLAATNAAEDDVREWAPAKLAPGVLEAGEDGLGFAPVR